MLSLVVSIKGPPKSRFAVLYLPGFERLQLRAKLRKDELLLAPAHPPDG
jgi:hypothetical protein